MRGEDKVLSFSPEEFPQLVINSPRLWWPVNKGPQNLYELKMTVSIDGVVCDSVKTKFGIREITSDTNTPDKSRIFYVNGKRLFIRGTNWIPEAMLRTSDERTYAELRYTRQSGVNLLRMWGGGIAESDYFFQLCDELGLLVWQEFWMTGDTRHPHDKGNYLNNVESTVKRIRNHPSLAYYVASNESTEVTGTPELLNKLDGTRGYQMQSECAGVHDGSPYKQVNPMQHYENTASPRGSRVDGFNPEYGAPTLPTVEILREMMDEKDLWPINKKVWSPTFVITTCGLASSFLALLIWIIDIKGYQGWCVFFRSFGVNPLFIYVFAEIMGILLGATGASVFIYEKVLVPVLGNYPGSLAYALLYVLFCWSIVHILYKKGIYVKI